MDNNQSEIVWLYSLIGAIIIVVGLYSVIWGKSKDLSTSNSTSEKGKDFEELPTAENNTSQSILEGIDVEFPPAMKRKDFE